MKMRHLGRHLGVGAKPAAALPAAGGVPRAALGPLSAAADDYTCSAVVIGGWQLSAGHHPSRKADDAILRDLAAYHAGGCTTFDMGDIYTGVEALIGRFVRAQCPRGAGIEVHTKFVPDLDVLADVDATHIRAVLSRSCRRLGVAALDLVQFHWWILEVGDWCAVAQLLARVGVGEGFVRRIGLTNFSAADTAAMLDAKPPVPLATTQVQYSLLDRRVEGGSLVDALAARRADGADGAGPRAVVQLLCYGVLAGGFLTDFWLGRDEPVMATLRAEHNRSLVKYKLVIDRAGGWGAHQALLRAARAVADGHRSGGEGDAAAAPAATIAMVAMAWVLRQPLVASIIVGTRDAKWLPSTQQACALAAALSDAELEALRAAGPVTALPGGVYELERDRRPGAWGEVMRYNLNQVLSATHVAEHAAALDAAAAAAAAAAALPAGASAWADVAFDAWLLEREARAFAEYAATAAAAERGDAVSAIARARARLDTLWAALLASADDGLPAAARAELAALGAPGSVTS